MQNIVIRFSQNSVEMSHTRGTGQGRNGYILAVESQSNLVVITVFILADASKLLLTSHAIRRSEPSTSCTFQLPGVIVKLRVFGISCFLLIPKVDAI